MKCCKTDLNLTLRFKYSTHICYRVGDISSIYRPVRARSVHENHQHNQGWNPTTRKKRRKQYLIVFNNNTDFDKDHLLCSIVMTSTHRLPHTLSEKLDRDNEKQALFDEISKIGFLSMP